MKFIMASVNYKDYTEELTKAGFKVETESEIIVSNFMGIKRASTGVSKAVVEVNTLDDLMKIKEAVGHELVIGNDFDFETLPKITVYDGYLE